MVDGACRRGRRGTRSGVNCTRWNWPPIAAAIDFTASVLAKPGTPSTRMCPRASIAHDEPFEEHVLPDDRPLHLVQHLLHRGALRHSGIVVDARPSRVARPARHIRSSSRGSICC